jgi:catechol 2,3-dioxygenase-like lactoylglutathione lyase family enzyme
MIQACGVIKIGMGHNRTSRPTNGTPAERPIADIVAPVRSPAPHVVVTPQPQETDMSSPQVHRDTSVTMKLEIVVIPVSNVDTAKSFYANLGWRLDADFVVGDDYRVIQFTPPGSDCSVIFGKNVTAATPGSAQGLYLIVSDIEAARADLLGRGVKVSDAFHAGDVNVGPDEPYLFGRLRVNGLDPARASYRSFASFSDPDGNGWLFQEITARLPGRIDASATTFNSSADLAAALRRAAIAHGEHEKRTGGQHDENWPDWYADYIVREQTGESLPT